MPTDERGAEAPRSGRISMKGWRRFLLLAPAIFVAYHGIILALFVYRASAWPNYFKLQRFVPEVIEFASYRPSWREWLTLVPGQPVYIYAVVFERTHTTQWLFVFTLKTLLTSIALSILLALNLVLMLAARRSRLSSNVGTCVAGVTGLFGAGVSAAACCGTASSSMLLSALGLGGAVVAAFAEYSSSLAWLGLGVLFVNALLLSRRGAVAADERRLEGVQV